MQADLIISNVYEDLMAKKTKLAVLGLGYVGLPVALEFAKHFSVIGLDINEEKVGQMKEGIDPNNELTPKDFEKKDIAFTTNIEDLAEARFFIVAVPTPVSRFNVPNLAPLQSASKELARVLKPGDIVVYESTVYPGCTEEDCVPILEEGSGLKMHTDFKVGYSPERINPGDKVHTLSNTVKIVSGCCDESLEVIANVYECIIEAGVHRAPSIKVAEAAKIIENTQRDLNIALMNELSMIFDKVGINTMDVIDAAGTKWNFLKFYPGLVGGHCIGVDPYYLTHKSIELGYTPEIILSGRKVNDNLSRHVAKRAVQMISGQGKSINQAKVLVMGITFKENVSDIRNSKVVDVVKELESYNVQVDISDPFANKEELKREYDLSLVDKIGANYDCIILAVKHKQFLNLDEQYFKSISNGKGILIDIKSLLIGEVKDMEYWTL